MFMTSLLHPSREIQRAGGSPSQRIRPLAQQQADASQTYLRLAMVICLYTIPLFATLQLDVDYDSWWHLRAGQWIVEHRAVTTTDPFSAYGQDKAWVAYSWLFEVVIYYLYQVFGLCGFLVFRAVMSLAVTAALHRFVAKREPRFLYAVGMTGLATLAMALLFKERPWLFTILFSIFTLEAILDLRDGRHGLLFWLLPLLFALWANLHIQFVYGLILLGLACVVPILDHWRQCEPDHDGAGRLWSTKWWQLVGLTVACFLATFATPYHAQLYQVIFEYATQPGPYLFIVELKALEFRHIPDWVMLAFAGCATYYVGRSQQGYFDLVLLAITAFLAFRMRRDLWFVILTALYILSTRPRDAVLPQEVFHWTGRRIAAICGGLLAMICLTIAVRHISNANLEREAAKLFPIDAAKFVAEHDYPGPLYNDFNWGGYLIWALPQYPVALDGRTNLHGDERILRFGRIWAGSPTWADDPDLKEAGVIIAGADMPLTALLLLDERFERVYQDDVALVFVRKPGR
jgi:hypothetical protein